MVHCFVKDTTQESLDALIDWASGVNIKNYAISQDFDNCFVVKIIPSDLKKFLFKSGSKGTLNSFLYVNYKLDYLGNEIFLRYTHKSLEKEIKFENINKKIVPTQINQSKTQTESESELISHDIKPAGFESTSTYNEIENETLTDQLIV